MGTVVSFDIYSPRSLNSEEMLAFVAARRILHRIDAVFSTYREHSPISRLRRGEINLDQAPPEVGEVLAICEDVRELTDGWFDPWALPGGVDPTGVVKGWSVERALDELRAGGVDVATVNAGGDISTVGRLQNELWHFGVQDPFNPSGIAAVVRVEHSIATSGSYLRGAHLFDPKLRRMRSAVASSSVVGEDLGVADGLATALAVAGPGLLGRIESAGYEGMVITTDREMIATPNFPFDGSDRAGEVVVR